MRGLAVRLLRNACSSSPSSSTSCWTNVLTGVLKQSTPVASIRTYKITTGIVGVEADSNAPETLRTLLKQVLRVSEVA